MDSSHGLHHISKRKRVSKKELKEYPHKNWWIKWFDRLLLVLAIAGPVASLPQIVKIFATQSAGDISVITYSALALMNVPWIIYGFLHKEKPIILAYLLWLLSNTAITPGAIIYS